MRERPILFRAPLVRAILAGEKTQTRRVMSKQPHDETTVHVERFHQTIVDRHGDDQPGPEVFGAWWDDGESGLKCPYGGPGDRLWVRETWAYHLHAQGALADDDGPWVYAADGEQALQYRLGDRWRPSIHMPRYACRILLEITDVRVERLHDLSEDDARAEGAEPLLVSPDGGSWPHYEGFCALWESINGAGSWDVNPWVWAVSFRRMV